MPSPCVTSRLILLGLLLAPPVSPLTAQITPTRAKPASDSARLEETRRAAAHQLAGTRVIGIYPGALARLPGAASIVTAATIRAVQPFSAADVLRSVPGVYVQEEEGAGLRLNVGIRGLDPDRSRTLLVLEDGVPVALAPYGEPELYYSPPIERMDRLEIVKGSGSILFGPQTVGGVLNYLSWDAPRIPGGDARLEGGSHGLQLMRVRYGGGNEQARGGITAFDKRATDLNGLRLRVSDVTGKIGFRAGANDFGVKVSLYDESSNSTYLGLTDSLFRASPGLHPAPDDRLRLQRYALTATHDRALRPGVSVHTAAYAYQTTRNWQRQDYTYNASGNGILLRNSTGNRDRAFEVAGIEPRLRALYALAGRPSELETGVRAHVERARDQFILGSTATSRTGTIVDDEIRTGVAFAAFAQNRVYLSDAWHVTPGVRVERLVHDRNVLRTRVRRTTGGTTTRAPEDVDLLTSGDLLEVIPGIGTAWTPREEVSVFAGAHRGFAPPRTKDALIYGDATLPPGAQVPNLVALNLDAERSWNYEVGTRLTPRSWMRFELTAFALDFSNQIIAPSLSAGSVSQAALANQGRTRHRGAESAFAFDGGPLTGGRLPVALGGSYTFVDAVFAGVRRMRAPSGDTVDVAGNQLPYAPRSRASGWFSFGNADRSARLDAIYVGAQYSDNFETAAASANGRDGRIPAYRVLDLSARYRLRARPRVALVASVKNVTDAMYIVSRRPEGIKPAMPRLVRVGLDTSF